MATALHTSSIPQRPNGTGYPRIKRSFGMVGGEMVGKLNVSAGTDDPDLYQILVFMLKDLAERGDYATLIRIRDSTKQTNVHRVTGRHHEILAVYRLWKQNRHVPSILGLRSLKESLIEWHKVARKKTGEPLSARTRESYRDNISQLFGFVERTLMLRTTPTDTDIPNLLNRYREYCAEKAYYVPFNQVRTMLSSYARGTHGRKSILYKEIRDGTDALSTERKRERHSFQVWEVRGYMAQMPKRHAQHVWNMCGLSCRPDEYAGGQWRIVEDGDFGNYVEISGTKTKNAKRIVPLVDGVKPIHFVSSNFRAALTALNEKLGTHYVPRDFRSTGKVWMEEAGIPQARVNAYFGHSNKALRYRYNGYDLRHFVEDDAKKLNAYIAKLSTNPRARKPESPPAAQTSESKP